MIMGIPASGYSIKKEHEMRAVNDPKALMLLGGFNAKEHSIKIFYGQTTFNGVGCHLFGGALMKNFGAVLKRLKV